MSDPNGPPNPLPAACAGFHAAFERERRTRPASDEESNQLADETDRAFAQIVGLVPTTEAALAAKASAALTRLLWQVAPLTDTPWRELSGMLREPSRDLCLDAGQTRALLKAWGMDKCKDGAAALALLAVTGARKNEALLYAAAQKSATGAAA